MAGLQNWVAKRGMTPSQASKLSQRARGASATAERWHADKSGPGQVKLWAQASAAHLKAAEAHRALGDKESAAHHESGAAEATRHAEQGIQRAKDLKAGVFRRQSYADVARDVAKKNPNVTLHDVPGKTGMKEVVETGGRKDPATAAKYMAGFSEDDHPRDEHGRFTSK